MPKRKFFGTDGIRGRVGVYPVTPEFMAKLGWAVGTALAKQSGAKVLIGKDTRLSGYMLESALESGLNAAGVDVYLMGPMPTPAVAYLTRTFHAQLGVVISASHNPHYDNGIKFFSSDGMKLPDDIELKIETLLAKDMQMVAPEKLGRTFRIKDAPGRYIEFCKSSIPAFSSLHGMKIALDCAHGATYHIAPKVFAELGAQVVTIGDEPNGLNINDGVGSTAPEALQQLVVADSADVGVALDGDGDRVVMVDEEGNLVDGDEILYIIAKESKRTGYLNGGGVVGTQMSNFGLEQALKREKIPFVRTKVGDRYVMQALNEKGWQLGGEASGHIIWRNSQTTGDGIVAALQVLSIMRERGASLRELLKEMRKCPQVLKNVKIEKPLTDRDWRRINTAVSKQEAVLGSKGRILIRPSGTEPLIRVMVEGNDATQIDHIADLLVKAVQAL